VNVSTGRAETLAAKHNACSELASQSGSDRELEDSAGEPGDDDPEQVDLDLDYF
jgi:hypothetical protein